MPGTGLMWQIKPDGGKYPPLAQAIKQASLHFYQKYGRWPTLVQCNPRQLAEAGITSEAVKPHQLVPPSHIHLWGVPEKEAA